MLARSVDGWPVLLTITPGQRPILIAILLAAAAGMKALGMSSEASALVGSALTVVALATKSDDGKGKGGEKG